LPSLDGESEKFFQVGLDKPIHLSCQFTDLPVG